MKGLSRFYKGGEGGGGGTWTGYPRLQLAFVLVKRSPVHLEAAGCVFPVKISNFVCLTSDKKTLKNIVLSMCF